MQMQFHFTDTEWGGGQPIFAEIAIPTLKFQNSKFGISKKLAKNAFFS